jgi:hypothetical protein
MIANRRVSRMVVRVCPSWALAQLILGWTIFAGNPQLEAQVSSLGNTVSIAGKLLSVHGQDAAVEGRGGPVSVRLSDKTIIRAEIPIKFSEITAGMYVGATAVKQPDGTLRASRLHIFSEDQRGTGEGHRPLRSDPQSGLTMTNANVESVEDVTVHDVKGRMLTLKYKGGDTKVLVPQNTLVVRRVLGNRSLLIPGAEVTIQATQTPDGATTATQITVRALAQ